MVAVDTPLAQHRSPEWLPKAATTVHAIDALADGGVFELLEQTRRSAADLAAVTGMALRPLELALDVAGRAGVVATDEDHRWFVDDPAALRMTAMSRAIRSVLEGDAPPDDVTDAEVSGSLYRGLVSRIAEYSEAVAQELVPLLHRPGQRIIEIGAGASPWGRALCAADPSARITAVDLPDVIDTTSDVIREAGFGHQFDFVAADVFSLEHLEPADLVVVAGFCRLFGQDANASLFPTFSAWCRAGGRIAVIDAVSTPEARGAGLSLYELGLLTRTSAGRCWSYDHYARWLTAAGFGHLELTPTTRPEITLVTAQKADLT